MSDGHAARGQGQLGSDDEEAIERAAELHELVRLQGDDGGLLLLLYLRRLEPPGEGVYGQG